MNKAFSKHTLAFAVAAIAFGFGGTAYASTNGTNVSDSSGTVVKDSSGNCVRTGYWDRNNVIHPGCEGFVEAAAPAPAPAPAPAAAPQFTTTTLSAETLFDFDRATLRPEGRATLSDLARQLSAPNATYELVLVEGHTDSTGPAAYNQGLSERRANSVANFLAEQGVRRDAMRVVGYGEERPVASNATREGRQANRRVEVTTDVRIRN
ncbi:MAG: OmpA family protein [Thioalkalivibrionaceae bacterium]